MELVDLVVIQNMYVGASVSNIIYEIRMTIFTSFIINNMSPRRVSLTIDLRISLLCCWNDARSC